MGELFFQHEESPGESTVLIEKSATSKSRLLLGLIVLAGCASSHEMKDGKEGFWGGGYLVDEISEGEFMITAKTNAAQLTAYGTARKMWDKHARKACGEKPYIEKDIREYDYEHIPQQYFGMFRYIVTVKEGIAICQ